MTALYHDNDQINPAIAMQQPLDGGRWGLGSEIADGVSFALSEESSWWTGQQLVLDGGMTAGHMPQDVSNALATMTDKFELPQQVAPKAADGDLGGKAIIVTGATSGSTGWSG